MPERRLRPVRTLLVSQAFADFADWMDIAVIGALLAYVWMVDPFVFALLAVAMGLPYLVVGPLAGAVVDRSDLRRVLVLSNFGRAAMTAGMILASDWPILLALVFARSSIDAFFTPAKQSAIQYLVDAAARMKVNGRSHAINQVSKIVAPGLGGAGLTIFAPETIFALNAGVSVVAALAALGLPAMLVAKDGAPASLSQQTRDGLVLAWRNVAVRRVIILTTLGFFGMFLSDMLIAPLVRAFGFSASTFGYVLSAVGVGGVVGSLWPIRNAPFVWVSAGLCVGGFLIGLIGVLSLAGATPMIAVVLVIFGIIGVASALTVVPLRTVLQNVTAPGELARVTALNEAVSTIALLTAPFIGTALASHTGIGSAFAAGGCLLVVTALIAWRWRRTA